MHTQIYFIICGLLLTESFTIKKKSNENNLFNTTIQEKLKMTNKNINPVLTLSKPVADSYILFGGNIIFTQISALIKITKAEAYKVSIQFPQPADTEINIFDGTYDSKKKVFISSEKELLRDGEFQYIRMALIVLKQSTPPIYVLKCVAYNDEQKNIKVESNTENAVSNAPANLNLKDDPDYEISFVNNMQPKEEGYLEFKMIENKYIANIDFTIKFTNKKNDNLNDIDFSLFISSKMGDADFIYDVIKNYNPDTECDTIFTKNASSENISVGISTSFTPSTAYIVLCKQSVILASTTMNYRIRGSVSSSNILPNGTIYMVVLYPLISGKNGNSPWGLTLLSSTPSRTIPVTPNFQTTEISSGSNIGSKSAEKGLSNGAIAGIGIVLILGLVLFVGIIFFLIPKK